MTLEGAVRGRGDKLMWPLMEGGLPRTADISPDLTPLQLLFLSPTPSPSHGLNCHHFPAYLVHIIIIIIIFVQGKLKKELSYKCCKDNPNRDWVYMKLHFYPKPLIASLTAYFIFRYISIHPTQQQTSVKLFYCGFHGYFEAQRVKPAQKVKKKQQHIILQSYDCALGRVYVYRVVPPIPSPPLNPIYSFIYKNPFSQLAYRY